jgi:hypothetical protein
METCDKCTTLHAYISFERAAGDGLQRSVVCEREFEACLGRTFAENSYA